ncbi:MAG: secondary thiamine-phosphate synthase enzyme YjbQ [Candidatus Heimdallarchaeota archaeon]|nr:secondary thiamine-phosphate synthase enzyme YjbQ [Candidatus Heimdallarchaeota archaeon]
MSVITRYINLKTRGNCDIHDITDLVEGVLIDESINSGIVTIFCSSSTSSVTTIEYETGCLQDISRLLEEIVPRDKEYSHNARWGDGNGHSHVRAALLGPSLTVPFIMSKLTLGTWQQIIHLDFDNKPRNRSVLLQIIGE